MLEYLIKIIDNRSEDKKKATELKKELETIEERFAYGKIPEHLYQKFSGKLEMQIIKLEEKISNGKYSTSNQSENIEKIIKNTQNLDKLWLNGTFQFKKNLQKAVFPRGMVVKADNKRVLTDNINEVFYIINYFSESCKQIKSGEPNVKFDYSASVPGVGVEPTRS